MMPRVLLFDLYGGGHHGFYLDVLCRYWATKKLPGDLHVAISPDFATRHADTIAAVRDMPRATVHVLGDVPERASLLARDRLHGKLLAQVAVSTGATHAAALYWDHVQLSTAMALRFDRPIKLSGIYFRPSFHYGTLDGPEPAWRDRVLAARKRLVLRAALRNPHLDTVFSLDPYSVPFVNKMAGGEVAVFLPDPVRVDSIGATTILDKAAPGRKKLLIFGVLDHRKGIVPVCKALALLTAAQQARLSLALAGPIPEGDAADVREALHTLQRDTNVEMLLDERFVPDNEIQQLVGQSDLVLLTYQHHIGSSNVLVRAAAACVPVLATNYGLVGAQVRRLGLGLTIDTADPNRIADAITAWLRDPATLPFDARAARAFAHANTAEATARTFWSRFYSSISA